MTVRSVPSDSTSRASTTPRRPTPTPYLPGFWPVWPLGPRFDAAASCPTPPLPVAWSKRGGDSLLTVLRRCAIMLLAIVDWEAKHMSLPQALMYLTKQEKAWVKTAREKLGMSESQLLKALALPTIRKIARMEDPKALRRMKA